MRRLVLDACGAAPGLVLWAVAACGAAPGPVGSPALVGSAASEQPPVVAGTPASGLPAPLDVLPVIDESSASSLWTMLAAPVVPLGTGTFEALAIRPRTRWGRLAISWSAGDETKYDALMVGRRGPYFPSTDNTALTLPGADAHVVAVTGGWNPRGTPTMVAMTDVRVLPIDPSKMLDDAAARWSAYVPSQTAAIEAALVEADRLTGGPKFGSERTEILDRFAPSWLPATRELEVVYARKVTRSSAETTMSKLGGGCRKYPPPRGGKGQGLASFPEPAPQRVACPPPQQQAVTHIRAYSADVGLVVRYRADGSLVAARPYAPQRVPGQLATKVEGGDL